MAETVSVEQIAKLHLEDGDILVVRCDANLSREDFERVARPLRRAAEQATGRADFPIVLCVGELTLDRLPEHEVRRLGWVRPAEAGAAS